jgi:hypothetical protein
MFLVYHWPGPVKKKAINIACDVSLLQANTKFPRKVV